MTTLHQGIMLDTFEDLVYLCAILCKLSYQTTLDLSSVKDDMLQEHLELFNETTSILLDQHGWIFIDDTHKTLYISFRGTDSHADTMLNFNFITKSFRPNEQKNAKVHAGFLQYYKQVKPNVFDIINVFKQKHNNDIKIVITGHSLGGAAAIMCCLDLILDKILTNAQINCITFGTPMLGNKQFCELVLQNVPNSCHIRCGVDIAPRIPIPGLQHVDYTIFIPLKYKSMFDIVNHHSMDNHLYAIKKRLPWLKKEPKAMIRIKNAIYKNPIQFRYVRSLLPKGQWPRASLIKL